MADETTEAEAPAEKPATRKAKAPKVEGECLTCQRQYADVDFCPRCGFSPPAR